MTQPGEDSVRSDLSLFAVLVLFGLMVLGLLVVWLVSHVQFKPAAAAIELAGNNKAQLRLDTEADRCLVPIRNRVLSDATGELGGVQSEVWACMEAIHNTDNQSAEFTSLPHEWRSDQRLYLGNAEGGVGVLYTLGFGIDYIPEEGMGLWGIALTGAGHNVMVFLNGKLLGKGGNLGSPYARNHARPMLFSIPDNTFVMGNNQFDIYVVSETPSDGFLGEAYIGPAEMLTDAHSDYHFFRFTTPMIIMLSMLLLSGLMCLLWFYRKQDVEYLLLGLMSLFWSLHTLDQFVVHPLGSTHVWNWVRYVSFGGLVIVGVLFIRRFLGEHHVGLEKMLFIGLVLAAFILWLLPEGGFDWVVRYIWSPLMLIGAFYALLRTALRALRQPTVEVYALTLALMVMFLLIVRDQVMLWGWLPVYEGGMLHFGAPFLLLAFTWILLSRFVSSLRVAETYNDELRSLNNALESRVEEKSQRIAQSYEMIRQLGQERVVQEERSRIMRDMHDGIGVYLTGMLRQLDFDPPDRENLKESAHNALNDLRLMIDSLGRAGSDLSAMLGMFRTRVSGLVEACQVELDWAVDELPPLDDFGPERALNLLRILQEAVTNALKHSEAKRIRLSAVLETKTDGNGLIAISVQDDGKGFFYENNQGNGLANMRHRAKKIGVEFFIDTSSEGTCVVIKLPIM